MQHKLQYTFDGKFTMFTMETLTQTKVLPSPNPRTIRVI